MYIKPWSRAAAALLLLSGQLPPAFSQEITVPVGGQQAPGTPAVGNAVGGNPVDPTSADPSSGGPGVGLTPSIGAAGDHGLTPARDGRPDSATTSPAAVTPSSTRRVDGRVQNPGASPFPAGPASAPGVPPPASAAQRAPTNAGVLPKSDGAVVAGLGVTIDQIDKAKKEEAHGGAAAGGAMAHSLDDLYLGDLAKGKAAAAPKGAAEASGVPDLSNLRPHEAAAEYRRLAESASALDAPALYERAYEKAKEAGGTHGPELMMSVHASVKARAASGVKAAAERSIQQAAGGEYAGTRGVKAEAKAYSAIGFWNSSLQAAGGAPLARFEALKSMIHATAMLAARETEGRMPAPSVRFKLIETPAGRRLTYVLSFASTIKPLPSIPEDLAVKLDISEAAKTRLESFGPKDRLLSAFELAPPSARRRWSSMFAAEKAKGHGFFRAFLAASWSYAAKRWSGFWGRVFFAWRKAARWLRARNPFRPETERAEDSAEAGIDLGPAAPHIVVDDSGDAAMRLKAALDEADARHTVVVGSVRRFERVAKGLDYPAETVSDEAVTLKLSRDPTIPVGPLKERFKVFDALMEETVSASSLIDRNAHNMTPKIARQVYLKVKGMAEAYATLTGDAPMASVDELWARIEDKMAGLGEGEKLPPAVAALVADINSDSLNRFLNVIHQAAVDRLGRVDATTSPNMSLRLTRGRTREDVVVVDLSDEPLLRRGRIVSPGLKALVDVMRDARDAPNGSLILEDHQLIAHFRFGSHSAEAYANFLPPDKGGMLRIRYQEWGTELPNQSRLYYVAKLLYELHFAVKVQEGFLTAVVDKDHRSQSPKEMMEAFSLALQALHATRGLDHALPILLEGSTSQEENGRRIDDWVDIVMAEGSLPFYLGDRPEEMVAGYRRYRADDQARARLTRSLSVTLQRLGLPMIPLNVALGRRAIELWFNRPIEEALARGELRRRGDGKLARSPAHDPVASLAADAREHAVEMARMAQMLGSLDPGLLDFQTIGAAGTLVVERAQRRLDSDDWLILYVLRDPRTGRAAFARAELGRFDVPPKTLGPSKAFELLAELGFPTAPLAASAAPAGSSEYDKMLREKPRRPRDPSAGFEGLTVSPGPGGPVTARVTYDKKKAAQGGYIFISPYTTPDDIGAIRSSKAVLTTSGGLSSHAAVTTRGMNIPAAIVSSAEWTEGQGIRLASPEFGEAALRDGTWVRPVSGRAVVSVREGDVVGFDPKTGVLEMSPRERGNAGSQLMPSAKHAPR